MVEVANAGRGKWGYALSPQGTRVLSHLRAAVAAAGELYPGLVVDEVDDIVLDDDRAVVYYSTDPEVETEDGERWIIEANTWAWDDC